MKHVIENKPLLSLIDVKEAYASDRSFVGTEWLMDKLVVLVKQKLNQ